MTGSPTAACACLSRVQGRTLGLDRSGGGRLDTKLSALVRAGRLRLSFDDIDMFQRIANVETDGLVQSLNTWDSAVVSIGFLQLTLRYGELQQWIDRAPAAFARYGIAVDRGRAYRFPDSTVAAIVGAATANDLRWGPWADRFYRAGLDDDIITAQVAVGLERNQRHLGALRTRLHSHPGAFDLFMRHYRASAYVRAVFQEAYNNRPAYARRGAAGASVTASQRGSTTTADFTSLLTAAIRAAYAANGEAAKADRIITKTRTGARAGNRTGNPGPAPQPTTGGRRTSRQWDAVKVTPGSIVSVSGIRVHHVIASELRNMIQAAAADEITLRGGGYRSNRSQINLRRRHCGPTQYDIYQKPSNQCRPPTARPGRSRHEQGLAVDFDLGRSGRTLRWLRANAARFGFVNLRSEPWHWSVDGR
jgi:hypothetical protein